MTRPRKRARPPRRRRLSYAERVVASFTPHDWAVMAWKDAVHKEAWTQAWADGTRSCGEPQWAAARQRLIDRGMVPPEGC